MPYRKCTPADLTPEDWKIIYKAIQFQYEELSAKDYARVPSKPGQLVSWLPTLFALNRVIEKIGPQGEDMYIDVVGTGYSLKKEMSHAND